MSLRTTFGNSALTASFMPAATVSATANGAGVDLAAFKGGIAIILDSAAGGVGGTMDVAIEDSADNVSFAPLLDESGAAITFAQVVNAVSHQKIAFHRHLARRYIRPAITIAGGGNFTCAAIVAGV